MKRNLFYIAFILIVLMFIILVVCWYYIPQKLENVDHLANLAMGIIAVFAAIIAAAEYQRHVEDGRVSVFGKMNKVFVQDENIQAVIKYLNKEEDDCPTINQTELFFRFFEELNVYLNAGMLDTSVVYDLFAYYCLQFFRENSPIKNQNLLGLIEFYQNLGSWFHLKQFVKKMNEYEEKMNYNDANGAIKHIWEL